MSDHEGVSALGRETHLPADIDVFELAAVGMVITDSTGFLSRQPCILPPPWTRP